MSFYTSLSGLQAAQTDLSTISHNLANVSTNGFKKSRAVFEDLLYQTQRQPGAQSSQQTNLPSGLQLGTGVRAVSTGTSSESARGGGFRSRRRRHRRRRRRGLK